MRSCTAWGAFRGMPIRSWPTSGSRHSGWPRTGSFSCAQGAHTHAAGMSKRCVCVCVHEHMSAGGAGQASWELAAGCVLSAAGG